MESTRSSLNSERNLLFRDDAWVSLLRARHGIEMFVNFLATVVLPERQRTVSNPMLLINRMIGYLPMEFLGPLEELQREWEFLGDIITCNPLHPSQRNFETICTLLQEKYPQHTSVKAACTNIQKQIASVLAVESPSLSSNVVSASLPVKPSEYSVMASTASSTMAPSEHPAVTSTIPLIVTPNVSPVITSTTSPTMTPSFSPVIAALSLSDWNSPQNSTIPAAVSPPVGTPSSPVTGQVYNIADIIHRYDVNERKGYCGWRVTVMGGKWSGRTGILTRWNAQCGAFVDFGAEGEKSIGHKWNLRFEKKQGE